MTPTDVLKHEHRIIERMLNILESAVQHVEAGQAVSADLFRQAVDFVRVFADRCHHGKEESNLFPRMEEKGVPRQGGPIGVMLIEHDQGRAYVRGMAEAIDGYARGEASARQQIVQNARDYIALLRQHIMKEDNILFPMADQVLSDAEQRALLDKFDQVENQVVGPGAHEKYEKLVGELEKQFR